MLLKCAFCTIILLLLFWATHACEEPEHCQKNERYCATRAKFRTKCPCTCAPDINVVECCENQEFERSECREFCTYDSKSESKYKTLAITCFKDFFKVQYCTSNGHSNSTECCLKNGVTKDIPGKPGCSVFCEVKLPICSRTFEYWHCATGKQVEIGLKCARANYDRPRWKANANATCSM